MDVSKSHLATTLANIENKCGQRGFIVVLCIENQHTCWGDEEAGNTYINNRSPMHSSCFMSSGITLHATIAMILPASLLLLPVVLANANFSFWGCLTGTELDNLSFLDRVSVCYSKRLIPDDYDYGYDDEPGPYWGDLPEYRLSTGTGPGSTVTCWPSKGGKYTLDNVFIIQRQFLGLDRRVDNLLRPEVSIEVEDAFCSQLRKLGAQWWEYDEMYVDWLLLYRAPKDTPVLYIGWPASGGVWALYTMAWDGSDIGYGVIYNSNTMEEQCEMIKEFGGTFYQDPKDCPYLDLAED
ncbi:hypothetical protein GGI35DRAFT_450204 [Trichoderma velutinum]